MPDQSHLDAKYFIDAYVYNCPFCNRRNVAYELPTGSARFDWSNDKVCYVVFVNCQSCRKRSMHLTYEDVVTYSQTYGHRFEREVAIDDKLFYSVPTSFFTLDSRIPGPLRRLITEAEGCVRMNYLTGASACTRKAIYEFLVIEKERTTGTDYESKIKSLKLAYPQVAPELFDALSHIQSLSSDNVHEDSWTAWNAPKIKLMLETLKVVLRELYVRPKQLDADLKPVRELKALFSGNQNDSPNALTEKASRADPEKDKDGG